MPNQPTAAPTKKVSAATLGSAVALVFWTVAASTFWQGTFGETALTALTGGTGTILAFAFGYVVRE